MAVTSIGGGDLPHNPLLLAEMACPAEHSAAVAQAAAVGNAVEGAHPLHPVPRHLRRCRLRGL